VILFLLVRPLSHVRQRQSNDCGIAAAAIAANVPYETAAAHSPANPGERGIAIQEIVPLLECLTNTDWRTPETGWFHPVFRHIKTDELLVLVIRRRKWSGPSHYITVKGGWVYDPAFPTRYRIENYPRGNWHVLLRIRPGRQSETGWIADRLKLVGSAFLVFFVLFIPIVLASLLFGAK
jgi:hypothetical protein